MQHDKSSTFRSKRRQPTRKDRGVALITTLLLLMLLSALTVAMAWSARSDMLINGYYRNFRGSFYAADSGLNVMRQALNDEFTAGSAVYPAAFIVGSNPLPSPKTEKAIQDDLRAAYGTKNLTGSSSGLAAKSWPESYDASVVVTLAGCSAGNGKTTVSCTPFPKDATSVDYVYSYKITSTGQSRGTESAVLTDDGVIQVHATLNTPPKVNFAAYGMFIDQQTVCPNPKATLLAGSVTGPVFTNGGWTFGTGSYTFYDEVKQVDQNAGFSDNNGCDPLDAASDKAKGISPSFKGGFTRKATKIDLPQNVFQQQQAVLDGKGADDSTLPTAADMNKVLKDINKKAYPSTSPPPTSGVFLPYTVDATTGINTFTGGGILVEGDASVVLQAVGANVQQYTITQGSGGSKVVTTILVDNLAKTTVMTSPGLVPVTIVGVPQQKDPGTSALMGPATMLFVDGNITSLSGPGGGQPAIQDGSAVTITAATNTTPPSAANISITGDLLYKQRPVSDMSASPPDQLIPGTDKGQALGIFTPKGDIVLVNKGNTGDNLEIDASMATLSNGGTGGITSLAGANQFGTVTIVGGRIQNSIKTINTQKRNILFDKRFANDFSPPWFPSGSVTPGVNGGKLDLPRVTRLQWLNTNATY